ncbi:MAG: hypothetical protein QOF98_705, partial [Streptomyces sp.]|nr:hypothetical protein [Streptomyces sp.]
MAVRSGDGDQEAQPVLAAAEVEVRPGGGQHVVQQRAFEAVVLYAAGRALEADPDPLLGPGEQAGHGEPGRAGEVTGLGDFG